MIEFQVSIWPAIVGLGLLLRNFFGLPKSLSFRTPASDPQSLALADLTIIIPARNEADTLPKLLTSLSESIQSGAQVIVVDDSSTDTTAQLVSTFPVTLLTAPPKPAGWSGKNWACQWGANTTTKTHILFTDADTLHSKTQLTQALQEMQSTHADLLTSLPFHQCSSFWEQSLSLFHVLLIQSTRPALPPQQNRLYANGQFLLFQRGAYQRLGGHTAVKEFLCEDLMLAKRLLQTSGKIHLARSPLYQVRMYPNLNEFLLGWSRNFFLGLSQSSPIAIIEIFFLISALALGPLAFFETQLRWQPLFIHTLFLITSAIAARRLGNFPMWSCLLWPWAIFIFILVTIRSLVLRITGNPVQWKGRAYDDLP